DPAIHGAGAVGGDGDGRANGHLCFRRRVARDGDGQEGVCREEPRAAHVRDCDPGTGAAFENAAGSSCGSGTRAKGMSGESSCGPLETARDLLAELEWVAQAGADGGLAAPLRGGRGKGRMLPRVVVAAGIVLAAAVVIPAGLYLRGAAPPGE